MRYEVNGRIGAVVGIGEVLWDVLPAGRSLGGGTANFAYHASQFGLDGRVVSAVGRDADGDELLAELRRRGIGHVTPRVDFPTGRVLVKLDGAGVPTYDICKDVAWDNIPMSEGLRELAAGASAVCFGTLAQRSAVSRSTVRAFVDAVPDEPGRLKVCDLNLRQDFYDREVIEESLKRCNILKINDDELAVVGRMFGFGEASERAMCLRLAREWGLGALILTCGVKGSYVFTGNEESYVATPRVRVVDTVGAGDSFTAAFVAGVLRGQSVAEAHRQAVATAAYVCGCAGAMPELPTPVKRRW